MKVLILVLCLAVIAYFAFGRSYYSHDHPILNQVRANFSKIDPEYAKIPLREGNSAYTENKSVITLCLKDPETGKFYDINTVMYVALHELSHMVSKTHGHNNEFKQNFSGLLNEATKLGIYDPRKPIPPRYCGVDQD